jgi:hypothetical protein
MPLGRPVYALVQIYMYEQMQSGCSLLNGVEGFLGPFGDQFIPLIEAQFDPIQPASTGEDTAAIFDDFRDQTREAVSEADPVANSKLTRNLVWDLHQGIHPICSFSPRWCAGQRVQVIA